MLDSGMGACVDTGATFDAFPDVLCDSLTVLQFEDLNRACCDTFP